MGLQYNLNIWHCAQAHRTVLKHSGTVLKHTALYLSPAALCSSTAHCTLSTAHCAQAQHTVLTSQKYAHNNLNRILFPFSLHLKTKKTS